MKRFCLIITMAVLVSSNTWAQSSDKKWTLDSRVWSTNYFTTLIWTAAAGLVNEVAFDEDTKEALTAERILSYADLVFPIGLQKKGFSGASDIYGPYHRAFSNPFKNLGDYGIGLDVSYKPSVMGGYAGIYYKSQEIVFKDTDKNLRGNYIQPRAGLVFGSSDAFEVGMFYDIVVGSEGSMPGIDKDMLKSGVGLDFALAFSFDKDDKSKTILQFSMPLHNFINEDYAGGSLKGMKRKVGYIMLTSRIFL